MSTQAEIDNHFMQRALALAARGVGLASPNPAVGCVLVDRDGQVIGEGWHEYERLDHAEVVAIKDAKKKAPEHLKGATAYVTLEPCNHNGRTGPCSKALIEASVARVVAATRDPNPQASGGLDALRAAEIEANAGLCEIEARRLNEGFAKWVRTKRPFVRMKVAMTLDGRIAPAAGVHPVGTHYWITGEAARAEVQKMRHEVDAVLTGIDTVMADDPLLTDRSGLPRRHKLLRVVLDSTLRIPPHAKLIDTADDDVVVFTVSRDAARADSLRSRGVRVEVLHAENQRIPLAQVMDRLGAEGILSLLTETGMRLNSALLNGGFVDRLRLFVAPRLMGANALPGFGELLEDVRLNNAEFAQLGDDTSVDTLLQDPWA